MKKCTKCEKLKDESEFHKKRRNKDGLSYWCKKCESEYAYRRYHKDGKRIRKYLRYEDRHRVVDGVREKRCRRCKKWHPESEFYRRTRHKDGLAVWCKGCSNEATNDCRRRRTARLRAKLTESG